MTAKPTVNLDDGPFPPAQSRVMQEIEAAQRRNEAAAKRAADLKAATSAG